MHVRVFIVLAAGLACCAWGIAGCGGDSTSALTKAQFIKQADAICKKADLTQISAMERAEQKFSGTPQEADAEEEAVVVAALGPTQNEAEEIAALGAPSGDEQEVGAIVEGIEQAVKEAEEGSPEDIAQPFTDVDKLSAEYGLKACAEAL